MFFNAPPTKKEEIKELEQLRQVKSSQIKTAYRHYDFRQGGHIKAQSSNFTIIQKPSEKHGKVYEMLGRPIFVHHRKASSKTSKGNSISTNLSVSKISNNQNKEEVRNLTSPSNKELWKKINEFTAEFEMRNNSEKEKAEVKGNINLKELLELTEEEAHVLKKINQNEKLDYIATNIFLKAKSNTMKPHRPATHPLISEVIGDLQDLDANDTLLTSNEQTNAKKDEDLADEAIRDFFKKIDYKSEPKVEEREFDSLNTVKSSGELEEDAKDIVLTPPLKESNKLEKSSSKLRNNDSDKVFTPNQINQSATIRQVFKFEILSNDKNENAAKFIQKRFRLFMKAKNEAKG